MTIDELKDLPVKKKNYGESKLQQSCVKWFRLAYPQYRSLFFAIPNGGKRNLITAKIMNAEGALAGVADLMLAVPKGQAHGLFIEMKFENGTQNENQQRFQHAVMGQRYCYTVCKTFDEFQNLIERYLQ